MVSSHGIKPHVSYFHAPFRGTFPRFALWRGNDLDAAPGNRVIVAVRRATDIKVLCACSEDLPIGLGFPPVVHARIAAGGGSAVRLVTPLHADNVVGSL